MSGQSPSVGRDVARAALLGTVVAVLLVLLDLGRTSTNPLNLVQPGDQGPSAEAFRQDFPDEELLPGTGLDGQQFYAIARQPLDVDSTAEHLDRPRYRLQRPLLAWLGALAHPSGGGTGLIWSLFAVNVAATAVLAASTGAISVRLGGPAWPAALVGLYPGVWWSLRVTVADSLATALALASIALLLHRRVRWATAAGVAAVLAKETAILLLLGWAISRWRDRTRWIPVVAGTTAAATWWLYLRIRLAGAESVGEVTVPLKGAYDAVVDRWLVGKELRGMLAAVIGFGAAVAALVRRGLAHPFAPTVLVQLVFLAFANGDVLGNDFGAGRATLPLLAASVLMLVTPTRGRQPAAETMDAAPT